MPELTPPQRLLIDLVEAERRVSEEAREHFFIIRSIGPPGVQLSHSGWLDKGRRIFEGHLDEQARLGFISMSRHAGYDAFHVTERGFAVYSQLMVSRGEPVARVESIPMQHIASAAFQRRHPEAFAKWAQAEALLWGSNASAEFTMIGHLAREAMQAFATSLPRQLSIPPADPDPAKTLARIGACLDHLETQMGAAENAFLKALLAYWGTVSDLAQRQEHGAQKEGAPLRWRDGERHLLRAACCATWG